MNTVVKREVVRLADLTVTTPTISATTFENCLIIGPAVVAMTGDGGTIQGCTFDAEPSAILWELPDNRPKIVGAIEAASCRFIDCRFSMVGFAGPKPFVDMFVTGVSR